MSQLVQVYGLYFVIVLNTLCYLINESECISIDSVQVKHEENGLHINNDGSDSNELVNFIEPFDERISLIDIQKSITFHLLTRINPNNSQIVRLGDNDSLTDSHFKIDKTTIFLSHGWLSDATSMNGVAEDFLLDDQVNVFNVDWSKIAKNGYITAKSRTTEVGQVVGDFINWLVTRGVSYDNVHLVGISLGAQLVGSAGRQTGGKVKKITGLDPAGPLWYGDKRRLQSTDAQFVEVIHTNTLFYGYKYPCGDVDVYPDGGAIMSACQSSATKNMCSHIYSVYFFTVSLRYTNHFVANRCSSFEEATKQMCDGEIFVVGTSDLNKYSTGIYRMETEASYPYKI